MGPGLYSDIGKKAMDEDELIFGFSLPGLYSWGFW
jgi:hypothetical protein